MMHKSRQISRSPRLYALIATLTLLFAQGCDSDTSAGNASSSDATSNDATLSDTSQDKGDGSTSTDDSDASQTTDCPPYQTRCNGVCIPTSTDPDNCGGCGVTCDESEVCSGGSCTDTCMAGLNICERKCVDFNSDNAHCGACDTACPSGQGCVAGSCEQAADLDMREQACADGGPTIDLGETVTPERQCTGKLAERTFRWAVCSCEDILSNSGMYADAYDSSVGPYTPGGEGGGVATNGFIRANSGFLTTGTLWAADELETGTAAQTNSAATIGQRLHAGSGVRLGSNTTVGDDAHVDGNIGQKMTIGGTLHAPDSATIDNGVTYADLQRGPVDVAPPCDACEPDERIPVGDIVASRSGTHNDNALIGLDEDIFAGNNDGTRRLDLPCGQYYLSAISTNRAITIVAHGNTALFIGGDIDSNSPVSITLTPDAQLDIFVAGSVKTNNGMKLGSPNYPALLRIYVGGDDGFHSNVGAEISGYIYAVPGGIKSNSGLEVFGGVFGQSVSSNSGGTFHFDRRINTVGESCPDPGTEPGPDPGTEPDPDICGTTADACETSDDCCAPLLCGGGNKCTLMECKPFGDSCASSDECCSGMCNGYCIAG